jgi:SAM-dependent methyltransferase
VQAARATERIASFALDHCVRCREGNFQALPIDLRDFDAVLSIESFVHSPDAKVYFTEASRVLRDGGKLIICDDFLSSAPNAILSRREQSWLDEFIRGWHVGSLIRIDEVRGLGHDVGLTSVRNLDLTPYLDLERLRDRFIQIMVTVGHRLPIRSKYWQMLFGGAALQWALLSGLIQYRFLVFERSAPLSA